MGIKSDVPKPKVLIVEDDCDVSSVIGLALEDFFDLTVARCPGDAILAIRSESFELVLLDWRLGNACGSEVLEEIDLQEAAFRPQVVITSGGNDDSLQEALQSGDHYVLAKPYQFEELIRTVTRLLSGNPNSKARKR